jgi:hypothetical protein
MIIKINKTSFPNGGEEEWDRLKIDIKWLLGDTVYSKIKCKTIHIEIYRFATDMYLYICTHTDMYTYVWHTYNLTRKQWNSWPPRDGCEPNRKDMGVSDTSLRVT